MRISSYLKGVVMTTQIDEHIVLDAYVSANRNKIVLRTDSWESVRMCDIILFRELENGSKQISCGDYLYRGESIEDIKQSIRLLLEKNCEYNEKEHKFRENIRLADVCLGIDNQNVK